MSVICGRSVVATLHGIVAASQPLAAQAGVQILERGGHAVDAAIAANAVLGLTEPHMNGLGGDLFALVYDASADTLFGLNASGPAPGGLSAEWLRRRGWTAMPGDGIHSVTVPGAVAGWTSLHARFGRIPFRDTLAPAEYYAEHGFPVSDVIAAAWHDLTGTLLLHAEAARTYLPGGRAPRAGEVFRNPALARSLRIVAEQGADGFYRGPIADAILACSRSQGGTLSADDLTGFEAEWVTPVSTSYRGWTVYELPPNTQGIAALMMLGLMEQFPLRDFGLHSVNALHVMIEAKKLAYADMLRWVADPRAAPAPVGALLDGSRARARAALIDPSRAAGRVDPAELDGLTNRPGGDTVYLSVVDRHGNMVSLIQSIFSGFGSGLVPSGVGFALHNRGALFTLAPDHPNMLAPGKRPLHTIIPGFMRRGSDRIGFGIMGGFNQAQAHAQFVAHVADFDLDIQQALEAGRFTKPTFEGTDVYVEATVPGPAREGLSARGHDVRVVPARSGAFGWGQAVRALSNGVHLGASEPRHDGAAIPEAAPCF